MQDTLFLQEVSYFLYYIDKTAYAHPQISQNRKTKIASIIQNQRQNVPQPSPFSTLYRRPETCCGVILPMNLADSTSPFFILYAVLSEGDCDNRCSNSDFLAFFSR